METIFERNNSEKNSQFVGRDEEIGIFEELVSVSPPKKNVLSVIGVGGIGKSSLIRQFYELSFHQYIPYAYVDISNTKSSLDLMKEIINQFVESRFKKFKKTLSAYYAIETKIQSQLNRSRDGGLAFVENLSIHGIPVGSTVVNLLGKERLKSLVGKFITPQDLDNYNNALDTLENAFIEGLNEIAEPGNVALYLDTFEEAASDIRDWLDGLISGGLSANYLLVIAGRDSIFDGSKFWEENRNLVTEITLQPFKFEECEALLAKKQIDDQNIVNWVYNSSGKLPWAIELTIEAFSKADLKQLSGDQPINTGEIEQKVVQRFLRQINGDAQLTLLVKICSVFNSFREDIIQFILHELGAAPIGVDQLHRYSFLRDDGNATYSLHDTVKAFITIDFKIKQPDTWTKVQQCAAQFFKQKAQAKGLSETQFLKFKLAEFMHTILVDQEAAMRLLLGVSKNVVGPLMFSEFYVPVVSIAEHIQLSKKNAAILSFFEAQIATINRDDEKAIALYRSIDSNINTDSDLSCIVKAKLSEVLYRVGRIDDAYNAAFTGLNSSEKAEKFDFAALFSVKLAEIYGSKGSLKNSEHYCKVTSKYLDSVKDPFNNGEIQLLLAHIYLFRNNTSDGEACLAAAKKAWRSISYEHGVAQIESSACWMAGIKGNWEEGKRIGLKAHHYFADLQDEYFTGLAALNIAQIFYLQGDYTEALGWNRIAHEKLKDSSMLYDAISSLQSGMCHLKLQDRNAAIRELEYGKSLEDVVHEQYTLGLLIYYLSLAHSDTAALHEQYFREAILLLKGVQNNYGFLLTQLQALEDLLNKNDLSGFDQLALELDTALTTSLLHDLQVEFHYLEFSRRIQPVLQDGADVETALPSLLACLTTALRFNPLVLYRKTDNLLAQLVTYPVAIRNAIVTALKVKWTTDTTDELSLEALEYQQCILEVNTIQSHVLSFLDRLATI